MKGLPYLHSISSFIELEFQSFEIIKSPKCHGDFLYDTNIVLIYLRSYDSQERVQIGELTLNSLQASDTVNLDDLKHYQHDGYFQRFAERLYEPLLEKWRIISPSNFQKIWCLYSIGILPCYRGFGFMELILELVQNKIFDKKISHLFFGFSFPMQYWRGSERLGDWYKGKTNLNLQESTTKLNKSYMDCGFTFVKNIESKVPEEIEAVYFDRSRHSHLFYKIL